MISARGSFRDGGHRSIRAYLKGTLNCSGAVANRIRRRASLVKQHPDTGEALLSGRVGVEQVDRLASAAAHPRAGERFGEFAPPLLEHAEQLEFDDFSTVVDHFVTHADPDGAFDDQLFHADHPNATVRDDDGHVEIQATGGGRSPQPRWPRSSNSPCRPRPNEITTCTHRGCDIPATRRDVDHRREWVRERGPTDQANVIPMCGPHDRWKHANHIRTRRATNGRTYLIRPDGSTVLPIGAREPDWAEPAPTNLRHAS